MTINQIKMLKDSYMIKTSDDNAERTATLGEYMRFIFDNGIEFTSTADFLIFDDDNEIMHCICLNDDALSQYNFPIKVMSAGYEIIFFVESIFTKQNFFKLMDEGFLSSKMSKDQKEFVKKWVQSTNNFAIQPMDATPYYDTDVRFDHKPVSVIDRYDGVKIPSNTLPVSIKVAANKEGVISLINSAKDGDIIMVDKSITLDDPLSFDKSIYLRSNGAKITSKITSTSNAKSIVLEGFNIEVNDPESSIDNKSSLMSFKSDEVYIKNCTIKANSEFYYGLFIDHAINVEVDGCKFIVDNPDNMYNFIDINQNTDSIERIEINNCTFSKILDNCINFYRFKDNCIVNLNNSTFNYSNNAIGVSNKNNANNVQINIINNRYLSTVDGEYAGFASFKKLSDSEDKQEFGNMIVTFQNLIGPGIRKMMKNGSNENQVYYTLDTEEQPIVNFKA